MIPKFYELFLPMLKFLAKDKQKHSLQEVEEHLAKDFQLSEQDLNALLQSGKQTIFKNRIGWAKTYLKKAGLIDNPERGYVTITDRGLEVLSKNQSSLTINDLMQFPEFKEFFKKTGNIDSEGKIEEETQEESPEETISKKVVEINDFTKRELLDRILKASPQFFERMVIDLIVKMGYGGSFEEASQLLGKSGDEGVDGLIKEDILGLDNIYIQAKRWDKGTVSSKEIRDFIGALDVKGATKGIFITTSTFTKDAIEMAKKATKKVVLIDGDKLLDYLIKYNVGVKVKDTIEMKKIDEDYFEEY